jgi:peptidoglycan/LPS O-acetylase OafA/YrhL
MQVLQMPIRLPLKVERGRNDEPRFRPNNFDLIRIFAALQVVLTHVFNHLHYPDVNLHYFLTFFPGVPIFFVTSGYLVSGSFERSGGIRRYFRNRFLRIYPGLWGCLSVTFLLVFFLGYRPTRFGDYAWFPLQFLGVIYTPQFLRHFGFGSYNGSLWTIPVELQFYMLLPLAYSMVRKMRLGDKGFVVLFALAATFSLTQSALFPFGIISDHQFEPISAKFLRICFAPHIYLFLLGVVFQRFKCFKLRWISGKGIVWLVCYILAACVVPSTPVVNVLSAIALGFVTLSMAYTAPRLGDLLLHHQDVSYGTYIYHGLLVNLVIVSGVHFRFGAFVVLIACTIAVAFLSWRLIERPCLARKHTRRQESREVSRTEEVLSVVN